MHIAGVEIPEDLQRAARPLRHFHCLRLVGLASLAAVIVCGVSMFFSSTIDSKFIRSAVTGGASGLAMWTAITVATSVTKKRIHAFLREHDHCTCGYQALPQGDGRVLACPECGSQWFTRKPQPPAA